MKRAIAVIGVALFVSAAPSRLLAQTATWTDGTIENSVSIDSGQLHYRMSKSLPGNTSAWWEYTVALADVDCLQFTRSKSGDVLSIVGKSNDSVLKKADPQGTTHGYEAALKHVEIDFAPEAHASAVEIVRDITASAPQLSQRINKGACTTR